MISHSSKNQLISVLIIASAPFLTAWEDVKLSDWLKGQAKPQIAVTQKQAERSLALKRFVFVPASRILQKSTSALLQAGSFSVDEQTWIEREDFHLHSTFTHDNWQGGNSRLSGKISVSLLFPGGISSSDWKQYYVVHGIPFLWNRIKREWEEKALKIETKKDRKQLEYGMLSSLFIINDSSINTPTLKLLGVEKRGGRDCFVLQYELDPKRFDHWNTVGHITHTLWVDTGSFRPLHLRAEGQIGDMFVLQLADYHGYDAFVQPILPGFILKRVKEEKEKLQAKIPDLSRAVAKIRGWNYSDKINIEFINRINLRKHLVEMFDKEHDDIKLIREESVYKWLGLVPAEVDFKEAQVNSGASYIAGLYDPDEKKVFIADWLEPAVAEIAITHEMAHAYQDINYDLKKMTDFTAFKGDLDMQYAYRALTEGEATAIMLEYLLSKDGKTFKDYGDITGLIEERMFKGSQYVRNNLLLAVYGYGANFIQNYLNEYEWPQLNNLYHAFPVSMRQVMHPFEHGKGEQKKLFEPGEEIKVKLPEGWQTISGGSLGEFLLMMSLRENLDKETSEALTIGWRADYYDLFIDGKGRKIIYFSSEWDKSDSADKFMDAFIRNLEKKYPGLAQEAGGQPIVLEIKDSKEVFYFNKDNEKLSVLWFQGLSRQEAGLIKEGIFTKIKNKSS